MASYTTNQIIFEQNLNNYTIFLVENNCLLLFSVLSEQTEALRKRKIEQLSQKIDIIIAGKRQKLLSKGITGIKKRHIYQLNCEY